MESKAYPHVFYNSTWGGYVGLLVGGSFIALALYGAANERGNELGALFFFLLAAAIIWIGWKNINDKKPALQFGPDGIWTPKLGFLPWEKVHLKFERISAYKSGSMEYLMIAKRQTRKHLDSIALASLKGASEEVKELLQQYWQK